MNTKRIKESEISGNDLNPRTITDTKLDKLVQSLIDFPEMLFIRPIVLGTNRVSLGGNMRLKAVGMIRAYSATLKGEILDEQRSKRLAMNPTPDQKAEFEEAINHLLYDDDLLIHDVSFLSSEKQEEFIIKDNVGYGEWDWPALDNIWGKEKIENWGLDMPKWVDPKEDKNQEKEVDPDSLETEHKCPKCGYEF